MAFAETRLKLMVTTTLGEPVCSHSDLRVQTHNATAAPPLCIYSRQTTGVKVGALLGRRALHTMLKIHQDMKTCQGLALHIVGISVVSECVFVRVCDSKATLMHHPRCGAKGSAPFDRRRHKEKARPQNKRAAKRCGAASRRFARKQPPDTGITMNIAPLCCCQRAPDFHKEFSFEGT